MMTTNSAKLGKSSSVNAAIAAAASLVVSSLAAGQATPPSTGDRVLGLDVSTFQGSISQATWNNIRNVENRQFVLIRSSGGGTTGTLSTLSRRVDDNRYVENITLATNAGMLAGSYHFARADIIASTSGAGGIANSGTD